MTIQQIRQLFAACDCGAPHIDELAKLVSAFYLRDTTSPNAHTIANAIQDAINDIARNPQTPALQDYPNLQRCAGSQNSLRIFAYFLPIVLQRKIDDADFRDELLSHCERYFAAH